MATILFRVFGFFFLPERLFPRWKRPELPTWTARVGMAGLGVALCTGLFACRDNNRAAGEKVQATRATAPAPVPPADTFGRTRTGSVAADDTVAVTEYAFSLKGPNDTEGEFSFPRVGGPRPPAVLARLNEPLSVKGLTDMTEQEIRETFRDCGCGLVSTDFGVDYNRNGLLAVSVQREWLGAYPSYSSKRLVFNTRTGELLSIAQILTPAALPELARQADARLQQRIAEAKREALAQGQDEALLNELFDGKTFTAAHLEDFTVTKDGIAFHYPFGFPHAAMALEPDNTFRFSFVQLKPYLKPGGPLARESE